MRIAVASEDGLSICNHFGRSKCFLVFEVEGERTAGSSVRANTATVHSVGECNEVGPLALMRARSPEARQVVLSRDVLSLHWPSDSCPNLIRTETLR